MNLTDFSLEELKKKEKTSKLALTILIVAVLIMFATQIYEFLKNDDINIRMLLPITFTFVALTNYVNLKKIRQEIASRK